MTPLTTTMPSTTTASTPSTPAVKANEGPLGVEDVKNSLTLSAKPEEKRQFLQNILEKFKSEPDKDETKTKFTNLLEDFFDNAITPEGRKDLEKMLGINLDTLKGKD